MIDLGIIITGGIGAASTIISGWASWFFTRKKYNSEVDQTVIKNMQEALQFYKVLAEDNKKRLEEIKEENTSLRKQNEDLEKEIKDLRKQVFDLMHFLCVDATCKLRKQDLKLFDNETKSRENS